MADNDIKYFEILGRPKDISIDTYLKVYDAFCKAYNIEIDKENRDRFSTRVQLDIIKKYHPDAVSYRPQSGGNKYGSRLFVTPWRGKGIVRFHAFSYNGNPDCLNRFIELAGNQVNIHKKPSGLEKKIS